MLLRWVPLAALLAVAMAVGLSFGPHPFGFHGWPKARAPQTVDHVVRVEPKSARVAVARREPAAGSRASERGATAADDSTPPSLPVRSERPGKRHRSRDERGSRSNTEPAPAPAPQTNGDGGERVVETLQGTPIAEAPNPVPDPAEAKPAVRPVTAPHPTVEVRDGTDDYEGRSDDADGHGHRHGHGRHGHH
jgi:hypothetical protein